jgi:hypothetical protein
MIPRFNIKQIKSKLEGNTRWLDYIPPVLNFEPPPPLEGTYTLTFLDTDDIDTDVMYALGYLEDSNVFTLGDTIFRYLVSSEEGEMSLPDGFDMETQSLENVYSAGAGIDIYLTFNRGTQYHVPYSVAYVYPEGAVETEHGWELDGDLVDPERIYVKPQYEDVRYELKRDSDQVFYELVDVHRPGWRWFNNPDPVFNLALEPLMDDIEFKARVVEDTEINGITYEYDPDHEIYDLYVPYTPVLSDAARDAQCYLDDGWGSGWVPTFDWSDLDGIEIDVNFDDYDNAVPRNRNYTPNISYSDLLEKIKELVEAGKIELEKAE